MKRRSPSLAVGSWGHPRTTASAAFTLIELMAVVLVILVLAAVGMGVAGYVQRKVAIATTKSQIAQIETALEAYKSDWGYYPPTLEARLSKYSVVEAANGNTLYTALFLKGKKYLVGFPQTQIQVKTAWGTTNGLMQTNLCDVWGSPFVYYCFPRSVATNDPPAFGYYQYYIGKAYGGQVNLATFDLFSYGPDQVTYIPGAWFWGAPPSPPWLEANTNTASAVDDIVNWKL